MEISGVNRFLNEDYWGKRLEGGQRNVFCLFIEGLGRYKPNAIFIEGPTGAGKTFALNCIRSFCEFHEHPVLAMAYTRMGSVLLMNGRTVYSWFKMPWNNYSKCHSRLREHSIEFKKIQQARVILWDQVTSFHKNEISEVDRMLRELTGNHDMLFGGKFVIMAGDFCECLPIRDENRNENGSTIRHTKFWDGLEKIKLEDNVRFQHTNEYHWLLQVGRGEQDFITLPPSCHVKNNQKLIKATYGDPIPHFSIGDVQNRTILTLTKAVENKINFMCLDRMEGRSYYFDCSQYMAKIHQNKPSRYIRSFNYFNAKKRLPGDFPSDQLELKVGCPIVLKRWYEQLQPGTRLTVTGVNRDGSIRALIATGPFANHKIVILPIDCMARLYEDNVVLYRRQLPVALCFAMTVHKAQGLSFDHVGLVMSCPVFAHGQLYMALSRVRKLDNLKVHVYSGKHQHRDYIKNIVYRHQMVDSRTPSRQSNKSKKQKNKRGEEEIQPGICF